MTLDDELAEELRSRRLYDFKPIIEAKAGWRLEKSEQYFLLTVVDEPPRQSPPLPETDPHLRKRFRMSERTAKKLRDELDKLV